MQGENSSNPVQTQCENAYFKAFVHLKIFIQKHDGLKANMDNQSIKNKLFPTSFHLLYNMFCFYLIIYSVTMSK